MRSDAFVVYVDVDEAVAKDRHFGAFVAHDNNGAVTGELIVVGDGFEHIREGGHVICGAGVQDETIEGVEAGGKWKVVRRILCSG